MEESPFTQPLPRDDHGCLAVREVEVVTSTMGAKVGRGNGLNALFGTLSRCKRWQPPPLFACPPPRPTFLPAAHAHRHHASHRQASRTRIASVPPQRVKDHTTQPPLTFSVVGKRPPDPATTTTSYCPVLPCASTLL